MKRKTAFVATCFLLWGALAALSALATEPVVLTENTAVELALQNSLSLKSARTALETLRRRSATSWNAYLPSLSAGAGLSGSQDFSAETGSTPWDLSLNLSASLPLSLATPYSARSASLQYQAAAVRLQETESALRLEVRRSFNTLLLGREKIALLEQSIQSASLSADIARRNYAAGLISEVEALSAEMTLEKLDPQLAQARADFQTALLELQSLAGLEPGARVQVEGSFRALETPADADALVRDRLASRPDVRAAALDVELRRSQVGQATAQARSPTASLSYSVRGGAADLTGSGSWSGRGSAQLSLSVPLDSWLPGSAGRVQVAEAGDELAKAELALEETRRAAEVEIRSLVLKLQALAGSLQVLEKNEQLARKVYELRSTEYAAGLTELTVLRQAQDDHRQAGLDLASARQQYSDALADLEHATQVAQ